MRNLEEFNGVFKDKICFIVGAGPSIDKQNLNLLKDHVVIAINSGYVATPWANFFLSDDHESAKWSYFYEDLKNSNNTVALLYENKLKEHANLFDDRAVLFRHRKGISIPDFYKHTDPNYYLGETRTSLGSGIMVSKILGCRKVGLLGVDCCRVEGKRYFWQFLGWKMPIRNDGVSVDKFKIKNKSTDSDLNDILSSWKSFGSAILRKIPVYNISSISKLNVFPKATLKEFLVD